MERFRHGAQHAEARQLRVVVSVTGGRENTLGRSARMQPGGKKRVRLIARIALVLHGVRIEQ